MCHKGASENIFGTQLRRNWSSTSVEAWKSEELITARNDRQLIRMVRDNYFVSASQLRVEMARRIRRKFSVWSIVNGFWLLAIGLCVPSDAQSDFGSLSMESLLKTLLLRRHFLEILVPYFFNSQKSCYVVIYIYEYMYIQLWNVVGEYRWCLW